jgi:NAD(P)-dependent dehydrogenase (short-subunit alcohol dehydrogenase family)
MGNPEDLISAVDFFIDRKNSYMTGQIIIIDGGRTII